MTGGGRFSEPGFRVGGVEVGSRALMAPMMGYNEAPLRQLCRRFGSGLAVTEMIKPEKLARRDKQTLEDLVFDPGLEHPLGAQLSVREREPLVEAALDMQARGFAFVDLNMGCPLKKECNKGWGAALLQRPEYAADRVADVVEALEIPVTVKVRVGYELGERTGVELVERCVAAGAQMICVHGRTKMGWYKEQNSLEAIREIVDQVGGRVPVVGNGDVVDLESAARMFEVTGCDAVMIGRGATGNPWLFAQVQAWITRGEVLPSPDFEEVRALYFEHMTAVQELMGQRRGYSQVRRYAFHYFGRFGLANHWRPALARAADRDALSEVLDAIHAEREAAA